MSSSDEKSVKWLVLFYLAGDLDSPRSLSIREDLSEILSAGKDPDHHMEVVVQFDSLGNCFRYKLESGPCKLQIVKDGMHWPKIRDKDEIDKEEDEDERPPKPDAETDPLMSAEDRKAVENAWKEWEGRHVKRQERREAEEQEWRREEGIQGSYFTERLAKGDEDKRTRHRPAEVLGRINSGSAEELENFIVWGLAQKDADKVALVVAGKDRLDSVIREGEKLRLPQVFTLCRDDSTRDHLSFVEFSRAIRNALRRSQRRTHERTKLDILAIDSAQSQFLELAHELEDSVEVLIGAQTPIPRKGWDYRLVLAAWRKVLADENAPKPSRRTHGCVDHLLANCSPDPADPHTVAVAKKLIEAIHESYTPGVVPKEGEAPEAYAVSAIDLTRLPDMTVNFDSACMTFMQALGEGIMWEGRHILREFLEKHLKNDQYDCGIFFEGLRRAMEVKSRCAVFDWLSWDLKQHGIGEHNGRFWTHVFNSIECPPDDLPIPQPEKKKGRDGKASTSALTLEGKNFVPITLLKEAIGEPWKQDNIRDRNCEVDHSQREMEKNKRDQGRLELIRGAFQEMFSARPEDASKKMDEVFNFFHRHEEERKAEGGDPKRKKGSDLVEKFRAFTKELLTLAIKDPSDEIEKPSIKDGDSSGKIEKPMTQLDAILGFLEKQDEWLEKIVLRGPGFPSEERGKSFEHMQMTRQTVGRLHKQAKGLIYYFPPRRVARKKDAEAKAAEAAKENKNTTKAESKVENGKALGEAAVARKKDSPLVLAAACTDPKQELWWTGLSLYRPKDLDTLMNREYRDFSFHRKVHWSALLGATYLIEATPPLAMWRLISSLITRGSGSTRRDLLEHLSGEKSVIWGMENQFRILAPAPVITLTLEHRETIRNRSSRLLRPPKAAGAGSGISEEERADDHRYLVRLESHRQGAVIFEHTSRVRAVTINGVLSSLSEVLEADPEERTFDRLISLGGILGDEVLQELARALESEQRSIRKDVRRRMGIRRCIQCGRNDAPSEQGRLQRTADDEARDVDVHLQLHIPRELMHHPWELMSIHNRMLGFNFAIGRRVFMDSTTFRGDRQREQGTIRLLLVVPRYEGINDLKELEEEKREIQECFEQLAASRGQIVIFDPKRDILDGDKATFGNFRQKLVDGDYDIIHFAGHGRFVADDPEASAWVLTDNTFTAAEIRNALRNHPAPPWLVYANACKAGLSARSHASPYVGEVHGLATAFIANGVAAYVGPLWDLGDGVARRIAVDFYKQLLLQGATLGEALLRAKRGVKDRFELERQQASKERSGKKQEAKKKGNSKARDNCGSEGGDVTKADDMAQGEKISRDDISGAGVVLFGDASGELIQALAGVEKISVQESGSFTLDQDRDQKNHQTNQTK